MKITVTHPLALDEHTTYADKLSQLLAHSGFFCTFQISEGDIDRDILPHIKALEGVRSKNNYVYVPVDEITYRQAGQFVHQFGVSLIDDECGKTQHLMAYWHVVSEGYFRL